MIAKDRPGEGEGMPIIEGEHTSKDRRKKERAMEEKAAAQAGKEAG